jgi:hypothetical protein
LRPCSCCSSAAIAVTRVVRTAARRFRSGSAGRLGGIIQRRLLGDSRRQTPRSARFRSRGKAAKPTPDRGDAAPQNQRRAVTAVRHLLTRRSATVDAARRRRSRSSSGWALVLPVGAGGWGLRNFVGLRSLVEVDESCAGSVCRLDRTCCVDFGLDSWRVMAGPASAAFRGRDGALVVQPVDGRGLVLLDSRTGRSRQRAFGSWPSRRPTRCPTSGSVARSSGIAQIREHLGS